MDKVRIKLHLDEWSNFNVEERIRLAKMPCDNPEAMEEYYVHLSSLIKKYRNRIPTSIAKDNEKLIENMSALPQIVADKLSLFQWTISADQWEGLTELQRFALIKLSKAGHESRNFPTALKEFGLI